MDVEPNSHTHLQDSHETMHSLCPVYHLLSIVQILVHLSIYQISSTCSLFTRSITLKHLTNQLHIQLTRNAKQTLEHI
jgi:hypothetical protein